MAKTTHAEPCHAPNADVVRGNGEALSNLVDDERIELAAKRILLKYRPAFMELAK